MNGFTNWDSELYHYGVLGMKWGIRKYQNKDGSLTKAGLKRYNDTGERGYTYKSHATKKYDRKAAKQAAKGNIEKAEKFKKRADKSRELDQREFGYANSVKTGGNIVSRLLTSGVVGGKAYQMHMAMSNRNDTGTKVVSAILSRLGGRVIGANLRKAIYIREDERKKNKKITYD